MRKWASLALAGGLVSCQGRDEALPALYVPHGLREGCVDPPPPPPPAPRAGSARPLHATRELSACLPAAVQESGLRLAITLARDGSPALIEADDSTCFVEIGADGKVIPPYSLDAATEKCLWDVMRDWHFPYEAGCYPPVAYVEIGRRDGGCPGPAIEPVEVPSGASTSRARPRSRPARRSRAA